MKGAEMQDTELYNALLGLRHPWRIREVKLDLAGDRVDVWVEEVAERYGSVRSVGTRHRFTITRRSGCGGT